LIFVSVLNWRLDVWLAPIYGVDLSTMHQLLPMAVVHVLSAILVAWTTALVVIKHPANQS
jgi:hypothetical protein